MIAHRFYTPWIVVLIVDVNPIHARSQPLILKGQTRNFDKRTWSNWFSLRKRFEKLALCTLLLIVSFLWSKDLIAILRSFVERWRVQHGCSQRRWATSKKYAVCSSVLFAKWIHGTVVTCKLLFIPFTIILFMFRLEVRYQKVLMRARFDASADEKDPRKAQLLLAEGCRELWEKRHTKTYRCEYFFNA